MNVTRRQFLTLAPATAAALALTRHLPAGAQETPPAPSRPNIVVILTDDQDAPSLAVMRKLLAFPGGGWTNFTTAVTNEALCAPSRATLLTGAYSHNHGLTTNNRKGDLDTTGYLPIRLQQAGYKVGHIGKWLKGNKRVPPPPGFALFSQGGRSRTVFLKGCDFIRTAAGQPFALFLCPVDPHRKAKPSATYARVDIDLPPLPPVETDLSDKPAWVQRRPSSRPDERERLNAYRAILDVDDGVELIVNTLDELGVLDNTVIAFASDNGYSWGSNGISGKNAPYDPSIRVPILIRVPGLANREEPRVVSMADLSVTIAELAGVTLDEPDGRSLVPLLHDPAASWPSEAYIEGYPDRRRPTGTWWGVRTNEFAYIENSTGEIELYDLAADPYQFENVAGQPAYADTQSQLAARLATMKS